MELGKKYDKTTLFRIRQFYMTFSNPKIAPLAQQLSWSHYSELLPLKDENKIIYYINQCIKFNLSRNDLRAAIKSQEYERLPKETKNKLVHCEQLKINDLIKNPIIINNIHNYEIISEKVLQQIILEDIPSFLDELGTGFSFIKNEYKIKIGN